MDKTQAHDEENSNQLLNSGFNKNFNYWKFIRRSIIITVLFTFFYCDIFSDINLVVQYFIKGEIGRTIATSIAMSFPTLFMIVFFCSRELFYTSNSKSKKACWCLIYIVVFVAQLHILFRFFFII
jgi:hypothetical protein